MVDVALHFLGELKVLRQGEEQDLPPSKKTRALLAYLALSERSHRREQLCELFWEIPDDPRGSLRWSLSKLRRLVDEDGLARIVADRNQVSFQPDGATIDVMELEKLVSAGLSCLPIESLEAAEKKFRGEFLEGLELPNFHEFSAWCTTQRERVSKLQRTLLSELVCRLQHQPEQGIDYALRLVNQLPYDKTARANLIRILVASGRKREAEQQVEQGSQLLKEVGEDDLELVRALRGGSGNPAARAAQPGKKAKAASAPRPLIGRDTELAELQASFDKVREQSKAACILLQGEPGIGKTHLLSYARAIGNSNSALVLAAGTFESEIVRPFALWNDALRDSANRETIELFSGSERIDREKLFSSLSNLVREESENGPVVVLFDDIQWCDESSSAALHYLLRMNADRPVWVILAARDQEILSNNAVMKLLRGLRQDKQLHTINLAPLQQDDISSLITSRIPGVDSELIGKESRGNPLLAIELARAVADGDFVGTLNDLVNERLSRLQPETVDLLRWASVLSPHIDTAILERMSDLDTPTVEESLEEAEQSGILLNTDKGYCFSHDLVARSIYKSIATSRTKYMHRRIAEFMEGDAAVDLELASGLARHASKSGDPAIAARSLVLASRLCLRFFANDDAYELACKGLEFAADLTGANRVCLILELKEVQLQAAPVDDWESAAAEYVALAEQALDHGALSHARLGYHMASEIRWAHGNWSGAKREIMQAERVTRGGSEEMHIVGMAEAARCLLLLEKDLPDADAMLMEVAARAERGRIDSDALPAAQGMLKYYENDLGEAESLLEEARVRTKTHGNRLQEFQANEYLTMIEIEKGDYQAAASRCQALLSLGDKLRQGSEGPFAHAIEALCEYALNNDDSGIEAALQNLRDVDAKQRLAYILNRSAHLDLQAGDTDWAVERATEALQNAQILDRASEIIMARMVLVEAYHRQLKPEKCRKQLDALRSLPDDTGAIWARGKAKDLIKRFQDELYV